MKVKIKEKATRGGITTERRWVETVDMETTTESMASFSFPSWPTSYQKICFLSCLIDSSPGRQHSLHSYPPAGFRPEPSMANSRYLEDVWLFFSTQAERQLTLAAKI